MILFFPMVYNVHTASRSFSYAKIKTAKNFKKGGVKWYIFFIEHIILKYPIKMIRQIEMLKNKEINTVTKIPDAGSDTAANTTENDVSLKLGDNLPPTGNCGKICSQCKISNCENK
jgi:hypothetical protein